ncbi:beta strand repeat-containing protein [Adhaeretor mobilis]|uniref:Putative lipoprotein n=1 Tax=Adhaeretor mobilis TaxID=1930276 RepID=A0A517MRP3_9BACT|nr:hypothetical protein [Adhaeretor mobilis]QDS97545.1 putative lipoprotein [Adhaeretor mobilis]
MNLQKYLHRNEIRAQGLLALPTLVLLRALAGDGTPGRHWAGTLCRVAALCAAMTMLGTGTPASADNYTWDGEFNNTWDFTDGGFIFYSNWDTEGFQSPDLPGSGDNVFFSHDNDGNTDIDLNGSRSVNDITFGSDQYSLANGTLTGNRLFINDNLTLQSDATLTINGPSSLGSGRTLRIHGQYNANGGITLADFTVLNVTEQAGPARSFTLGSGSMLTAFDQTQLNFTGDYEVDNNATFDLNSGSDWTLTERLNIGNGSNGTVDLNGLGTTLVAGGAAPSALGLSGATGTLTLTSDATATFNAGLDIGSAANPGAGVVTLTSGSSSTVTGELTLGMGTSTGTLTVSGDSAVDANGATRIGPGGTLNINTTNGITPLPAGGGVYHANGDVFIDDGILNSIETPAGNSRFNLAPGNNLTAFNSARVRLTGDYTVTNGSVVTFSTSAVGQITGDLDIGAAVDSGQVTISGGQLTITDSSTILPTGTLEINSGGTYSANGGLDNSQGGTLTFTDGNLNITGGAYLPDLSENYILDGASPADLPHLTLGAGASANFSTAIFVGDEESGRITVSGGADVVAANGSVLGSATGSSGTATVTGPGSTWNSPADFFIGLGGTGTLNIEDGGVVDSTQGTIGRADGSTGTATVTGQGSAWFNAGILQIGRFENSNGTLNIVAGGAVTNTEGILGGEINASGTATVTGGNSTWVNSDLLDIGFNGTGTLIIEAGGKVTNTSGTLGLNSTGIGTATITGTGSRWENSGTLDVGRTGTGTLNIEAGGVVTNTTGNLGRNSSGIGTATVNGVGSAWVNTHSLNVGLAGTGSLTTSNEGAVFIGDAAQAGGTGGSITISDTSADPAFGGLLVVQNSGTLSQSQPFTRTIIGDQANEFGTATVTGAGSTWTNNNNSGYFIVGNSGTGVLNIEDGGVVTTRDGTLGSATGAMGTATVTGAGSTWNNTAGFNVGTSGTGILNIDNGGSVVSERAHIGNFVNANGTATVTGADSAWDITNTLTVGQIGTGTLNVEAGGHISVGASFRLQSFGGTAFLNFTLASTADPLIDVGEDVNLAGTLGVDLDPGLTLSDGDSFTLIDIARTRSGVFGNVAEGGLLGSFNGVDLFLTYTGGDGNDVVAFAALPGDYDGDSDVDGADFLTWQREDGMSDGLTDWQDHYGTQPPPSSASASQVPEPTTVALTLLASCCLLLARLPFVPSVRMTAG